MNKPNLKPRNPNFSSGPTTKRPGWTTKHLEFALLGRSHRSPDCKARLKDVIEESKNILDLPKDFLLVTPGIRPAGSELGDQQRVATPSDAIAMGSNYLVVGRPITRSADPLASLKEINASLGY